MKLGVTRRRIRGFIEHVHGDILSEISIERIGRQIENEFGVIDGRRKKCKEADRQFVLQIGEATAQKIRRQERAG